MPGNLELRDLRLLEAIQSRGTLTAASRQLYLTQSALSRRLADLERRLGVPLFVRSGRRLVPAAKVQELRAAANRILSDVSAVEESLRAPADPPQRVIRVSTECYTCYHWLPAIITEYREAHPDVAIRIVAEATRFPLEALHQGRIDVAIVSSRVTRRDMRTVPLFTDELVALVARDHVWASRSFINPRDFATERLITHSVDDSQSTLLQSILGPAGVRPKALDRVELTEAIVELVRANLGVAVLAQWAIQPLLQRRSALAAVRIRSRATRRRWSAVTQLASANSGPHLREFLQILQRVLRSNRLPANVVPLYEAK